MLQCKDCEFYSRSIQGGVMLRCDPFSTIKEPECLQKWQLVRLDGLLRSYQAILNWYQKISPMQEKMMLFMPVVFTFLFWGFPSGLVLYWLVNNVISIAQQMYINKSLKEA